MPGIIALNEGRGANPGDTEVGPLCVHADDARSTKAGARTPATRNRGGHFRPAVQPLNEGRGANPGDTRDLGRVRDGGDGRSTKAGARTPATPAPPVA